jgi:hypothetical protein
MGRGFGLMLLDIGARNLLKAVAKRGFLPNNCKEAKTERTKIDCRRAEKAFGFKFQSYKEQVKSLVGQYLLLKG